jgi:HK97 family phage portal protein
LRIKFQGQSHRIRPPRLRLPSWRRRAAFSEIQQARATNLDPLGVGPEWSPVKYAEFMTKSVPAYRAVHLRAQAIRSAPLNAVITNDNDTRSTIAPPTHPLQTLIEHPNPWWTMGDILYSTEMNLALQGSAFWFRETSSDPRNGTGGRTTALWPLRPDRVKIVPGKQEGDDYIKGFIYTVNGKDVPLLPEEVVWFRYVNPLDEYAGLSPVAPGRLTLEMGQEAVRFNHSFFKNSAMPQDLIFVSNHPLTDDVVEDFYRRLERRFKGSANAHRPMIWDITGGAKPERVGLTQQDMQFMDSLNYTVEDAARVWGVPPPLMMSQKMSTYNNVREARIQFYTGTVAHEWEFIEDEINHLFVPQVMGPRATNIALEFDKSEVFPLQEAMAEFDERDMEKIKLGTLTINEFRAIRNMEPVDWGDVYWADWKLVPVSSPEDVAAAESETTTATPTASYRPRSTKQHDPLEKYRKQISGIMTSLENRFKDEQLRLFKAQRVRTLRNLKAVDNAGRVRDVQDGVDLPSIFNANTWINVFIATGTPVAQRIAAAALTEHADAFGLGEMVTDNPFLRQLINDRVAFWAGRVNAETARMLLEELAAGLANGEGIDVIAQRINRVFDFNDNIRAERIARTEITGLVNASHVEAYRQSGVIHEKRWLATFDERTRDTHIDADGQTVPVDGKFSVGMDMLEYPGDPRSSGAEIINCRCTVTPILPTTTKAHTNGRYNEGIHA